LGLLAGLLLALAASAASAEVTRLEVVGVAPAGADAPRGVSVRDAALRSALEEGVGRVARSLLSGSVPGPEIERALGDPRSYAVSYRILEDRGERRALLLRDPSVSTEYVLLVAVAVDRTRVEQALSRAGLLSRRLSPSRRFRVSLEQIDSYPIYERVRRGLEGAGARRAVPYEIGPGRVVLQVDAPDAPERLIQRLVESGRRQGLEIRVLEVDGSLVRLRAVEKAPPGSRSIAPNRD
jgi:hypothetical protein